MLFNTIWNVSVQIRTHCKNCDQQCRKTLSWLINKTSWHCGLLVLKFTQVCYWVKFQQDLIFVFKPVKLAGSNLLVSSLCDNNFFNRQKKFPFQLSIIHWHINSLETVCSFSYRDFLAYIIFCKYMYAVRAIAENSWQWKLF